MNDTPKGAASARTLPRRRFFNDMPDKGLFALTAFAGFGIILWLKVGGEDPTLVAMLAVTAMFVYGVAAYNIPAVSLRRDRLGDNFYYLGFIYTLASMSAALMQLRGGIEIEPILGSFGIALVTTIVGVAGRVTFVQMRGEMDEAEEQTRRDLVAASTELRSQLAVMLRDFETFCTSMRQTAEETARQSAEASQNQIEIISRVAQAAAEDVKRAFEGNRSSVQHLADTVERVAKAVDQTNEHFAKMELPTKRFEDELNTFGLRLVGLVEELGTAAGLAKKLPGRRWRWYWPFTR